MSKQNKRGVVLGGYGHALCLFNEAQEFGLPLDLVGIAPAYDGEALDFFTDHPWFKEQNPPVFENVAAALDSVDADVAIVSTRHDQICGAICAALEAGLDVITEKPLALNHADLQSLFERVQKTGRRVLPMFSMRAMPAFRTARAWVQAGKIGDPVLVNARKSYRWGNRPEWCGDRAIYGGTWPWVGIHAVDMTEFITGLSPVSVAAHQANRAHPERPDCEDSCAALFQLDNGGSLTASVDILRPDTAPTHGDDYCRIVGMDGIIEANASAGTLSLLQNGAEPVVQECSLAEQPIYGPFIESLGDPAADRTETALGFILTDVVLQARESADAGQILSLTPEQWSI